MLYCERMLYNENRIQEVVLDFFHSGNVAGGGEGNEPGVLEEIVAFAGMMNQTVSHPLNSLLILQGVKTLPHKGFRAGSWYEVPLSLFDSFQDAGNEEANDLVLMKLVYHAEDDIDLTAFKLEDADWQYASIPASIRNQNQLAALNARIGTKQEDVSLQVRNVWCANWNEVYSGDELLFVYDFGLDLAFDNRERSARSMAFDVQAASSDRFFGVISHWDLDHYNGLIDMKHQTVSRLAGLICPVKIPNTDKVRRLFHKLNKEGIPVQVIPSTGSTSHRIELHPVCESAFYTMYRSTDGSDRNQSGIVMEVNGRAKTGILTGDHHYLQLLKGVMNRHKTNPTPYELVVPHHGGNAGKWTDEVKRRLDLTAFSCGILSTRSDRYRNVPRSEIHRYFVEDLGFACFCKSCSPTAAGYVVSLECSHGRGSLV